LVVSHPGLNGLAVASDAGPARLAGRAHFEDADGGGADDRRQPEPAHAVQEDRGGDYGRGDAGDCGEEDDVDALDAAEAARERGGGGDGARGDDEQRDGGRDGVADRPEGEPERERLQRPAEGRVHHREREAASVTGDTFEGVEEPSDATGEVGAVRRRDAGDDRGDGSENPREEAAGGAF
jgi:hypothetical protein